MTLPADLAAIADEPVIENVVVTPLRGYPPHAAWLPLAMCVRDSLCCCRYATAREAALRLRDACDDLLNALDANEARGEGDGQPPA